MQFLNRQDWLEWRHRGIGSSDCPIIAGKSPWMTKLQLFESKSNPFVSEMPPNFQQEMGNIAEPKIRAAFELKVGRKFEPACVELANFPFIKCSFDGLNKTDSWFIEIKLLGKDDYEKVCKGMVPEKYQYQVGHQYLFGYKKCSFLGYPFKEFKETRLIKIGLLKEVVTTIDGKFSDNSLSMKDFCAEILQNNIQFWDSVTKKKPPVAGEKDYVPLTGHAEKAKEWLKLEKKRVQIAKNLEDLEAQQEVLEKYLKTAVEKTGHSRVLCAGIKITQGSRVGNVDYSRVPQLNGVDLEKYRKAGTVTWKFEPLK